MAVFRRLVGGASLIVILASVSEIPKTRRQVRLLETPEVLAIDSAADITGNPLPTLRLYPSTGAEQIIAAGDVLARAQKKDMEDYLKRENAIDYQARAISLCLAGLLTFGLTMLYAYDDYSTRK